MADWLTTVQAAELAGLSRTALLSLASRARRAGRELHAPADDWPDRRTPLWDGEAIGAELGRRPGRGANLRKISGELGTRAPAPPEDFPPVTPCPGQLPLPHRSETNDGQ